MRQLNQMTPNMTLNSKVHHICVTITSRSPKFHCTFNQQFSGYRQFESNAPLVTMHTATPRISHICVTSVPESWNFSPFCSTADHSQVIGHFKTSPLNDPQNDLEHYKWVKEPHTCVTSVPGMDTKFTPFHWYIPTIFESDAVWEKCTDNPKMALNTTRTKVHIISWICLTCVPKTQIFLICSMTQDFWVTHHSFCDKCTEWLQIILNTTRYMYNKYFTSVTESKISLRFALRPAIYSHTCMYGPMLRKEEKKCKEFKIFKKEKRSGYMVENFALHVLHLTFSTKRYYGQWHTMTVALLYSTVKQS